MIIRVSTDLVRAILSAPNADPEVVPPSGAPYPMFKDLSHLKEMVPEWLGVAVCTGSVVVIDREDYEEIPFEVMEHVEVLKW